MELAHGRASDAGLLFCKCTSNGCTTQNKKGSIILETQQHPEAIRLQIFSPNLPLLVIHGPVSDRLLGLQYLSPGCFNVSCFEPGLKAALDAYDPGPGLKKGRFLVAETACFGCKGAKQWEQYFRAVFDNIAGEVPYMRYYNIEPFLAAPGAVEGLRNFVAGWRDNGPKLF